MIKFLIGCAVAVAICALIPSAAAAGSGAQTCLKEFKEQVKLLKRIQMSGTTVLNESILRLYMYRQLYQCRVQRAEFEDTSPPS